MAQIESSGSVWCQIAHFGTLLYLRGMQKPVSVGVPVNTLHWFNIDTPTPALVEPHRLFTVGQSSIATTVGQSTGVRSTVDTG